MIKKESFQRTNVENNTLKMWILEYRPDVMNFSCQNHSVSMDVVDKNKPNLSKLGKKDIRDNEK